MRLVVSVCGPFARCHTVSVQGLARPYLTTKLEVCVALFVRELLGRLQTDLHQTWQGDRGHIGKSDL